MEITTSYGEENNHKSTSTKTNGDVPREVIMLPWNGNNGEKQREKNNRKTQ